MRKHKLAGIYRITIKCGIDRSKHYIGQSVCLLSRWRTHIVALRRGKHFNMHLQRAFDKYGEFAVTFSPIIICEPKPDILQMYEQIFVDSIDPDLIFNIRVKCVVTGLGVAASKERKAKISAAILGIKRSEETKMKIGEAQAWKKTEEGRMKLSQSQKGRPPTSEETKMKMSLSATGRIKSEQTKAKTKATRMAKVAATGSVYSEKAIQNIREGSLNRKTPVSDETKARMSAAQKGKRNLLILSILLREIGRLEYETQFSFAVLHGCVLSVLNLHQIVFPIIGVVNSNQIISVAVSIGNVVATDGSQAPGYATPGAITASIGGTFTASIPDPVNNPTTLNISAVLTGSLQATDAVSGTDGSGNSLPAGTSILSQLGGTPGGVGTYQLSAPATLGSCTVTSASDVLNVSAVAAGVLQAGETLADGSSHLLAGTLITGQLSGSQGSPGLYSISQQQTVASEAMSTSLSLFAQVQPMATGDLRHMDALNIQGSHRALYYNGQISGVIRVALKGGDIVTLANGSVWKVTDVSEPFFDTAGWTKVTITQQLGS